MTDTNDKVTSIGRHPVRILPEMTIRWLMQNMDQVQDLIVFVKLKGAVPIVSVTTDTAPSTMALAGVILHDLALDAMNVVPPSGNTPSTAA